MTAPVRFPRFFVTSPAPCPYLPGRSERKVFTELKGPNADSLNDALGRIGFRRSQTVAYRPSCLDCNACVSVRVSVDEFAASASQKRTLKRNDDIVVTVCRPWSTSEQFELLQRYLASRHPEGGMTTMDDVDFADMVEHTPVTSYIVEYREPSQDGVMPGKLIGACLTDRQCDGLSMIYSFYEPAHPSRESLGNFIILDHIRRAREMDLAFVYLGYWVEGAARMQYKVRFRPMDKLGRTGWERIPPQEQERLIAQAAANPRRRDGAANEIGSGKDGMAPIRV